MKIETFVIGGCCVFFAVVTPIYQVERGEGVSRLGFRVFWLGNSIGAIESES
jgi:hypothetical protein